VTRLLLPALLGAALAACADPAEGVADATPLVADADPVDPDADLSVPRPGFGALSGMCGVLDEAELTGASPALFTGRIDFATDRYDDPGERALLTEGGATIVASKNEGGSSIFSETFAFEILARCELATLVKLEIDIDYDVEGDKTDILVAIDGHPIGVSVTRAVTFPFGMPYQAAAAVELVERKLAGILESSANVTAADAWEKQILAVLAYDDQHAEVFADAWADASAALRADTLLLVFVTDGDDRFIYTDS